MFGSFLPEPWFGFGTTKSTQVAGADIVMKSRARRQISCHGRQSTRSSRRYFSSRFHFGKSRPHATVILSEADVIRYANDITQSKDPYSSASTPVVIGILRFALNDNTKRSFQGKAKPRVRLSSALGGSTPSLSSYRHYRRNQKTLHHRADGRKASTAARPALTFPPLLGLKDYDFGRRGVRPTGTKCTQPSFTLPLHWRSLNSVVRSHRRT
jgi:hypothetical protein